MATISMARHLVALHVRLVLYHPMATVYVLQDLEKCTVYLAKQNRGNVPNAKKQPLWINFNVGQVETVRPGLTRPLDSVNVRTANV